MTKTCSRCNEAKPLEEFCKAKDVYLWHCKKCHNAYNKKFYTRKTNKRVKLTHGEAYVIKRSTLDFSQDLEKICKSLMTLPPRMKPKDAKAYYGQKFRDCFGTNNQIKDFDKPEHYYDFWEAKKTKREVLKR